MKKNGIPEDQIILFAFDDIANNSENPFPGQVFNKPNGIDVYEGVFIDYKGSDVTPENFLNVLKGNKESMKGIGSGKVLESTL
jgi:legumain